MTEVVLGFEVGELIIIYAVFFGAALAKGVTGLGFSTACLPFLVLALGLRETLPLLLLPSMASNLLVMRSVGHFRATVVGFWPLFLAQVPGVLLGLWLLTHLAANVAVAVLGVVLIAYCVFAWATPQLRLASRFGHALRAPTGFATGVLNGWTGSQVMPMMPYFLSLNLDPKRLVQTVNCSFTLSSLVMLVGLSQIGLMTWRIAAVSLVGLVAVYLGVRLGGWVRDCLAPALFRKTVLAMMVFLGVVMIARVAWNSA